MKNTFLARKDLLYQFSIKEIKNKYRGSYLGFLWIFIAPFVMLSVYTFVFSVIFRAKWNIGDGRSGIDFAIPLLCGLIVFNIFSECATRAPSLMLTHANYVKKVNFPLEILPVSVLVSALLHFVINFCILLVAVCVFIGIPPVGVLLVPVLLVPFGFFILGVTLFLSSLGVFVRDLFYSITLVVQILFFMTPVVYPLNAVPEKFRAIVNLNVMAVFIENTRSLILATGTVDWEAWAIASAASFGVFAAGYWWFMQTKKMFGDVL